MPHIARSLLQLSYLTTKRCDNTVVNINKYDYNKTLDEKYVRITYTHLMFVNQINKLMFKTF